MAFLDREINFNEDADTLAKSQVLKDATSTPSTATKSLPKFKTKHARIRMPNSSTTTTGFHQEEKSTFKPVRKGVKHDRYSGVNQYIRHLDKRTQEILQMKTSQNFLPDKQKTTRNATGRHSVIIMSKKKGVSVLTPGKG